MRLLLGAQSCGFGPVSKLTAISRGLEGHHRVCVGVTVASDFAHQNADAYDEVIELGDDPAELEREVSEADWVVSVMNADLVFTALAAGRPVMLVDSLLAFWQLERTPDEIAATCRTLRATGYQDWREQVATLNPHEQIYAAHLCADASAAQNFPGVAERVAELCDLGAAQPMLTGAIVDETGLRDVVHAPEEPIDLLVNVGGFKNFLLDYDNHNQYLTLVSRWVPDLVAAWPQLERVVVCGGAYGGDRAYVQRVGDSVITFECLPQRDFIAAAANARHYLLTPGLTAIHESLALGRFPMALPEEHYGHIANLEALAGTGFGRQGARFADLLDGYSVPADDFAGTAAIVEHVGALLDDDAAYARFVAGMDERIAAYVALTEEDRTAGVAELRELLSGPSFLDVLRDVIPAADTAGLQAGAR